MPSATSVPIHGQARRCHPLQQRPAGAAVQVGQQAGQPVAAGQHDRDKAGGAQQQIHARGQRTRRGVDPVVDAHEAVVLHQEVVRVPDHGEQEQIQQVFDRQVVRDQPAADQQRDRQRQQWREQERPAVTCEQRHVTVEADERRQVVRDRHHDVRGQNQRGCDRGTEQ